MELANALQRLSEYSNKNTRASRQIFENGVVIFRNNALHKLGDDSACCNLSPAQHRNPPDPLHFREFHFTGWQFLESLALAAVDVGRIDVAEVGRPTQSLVF